MTRRNPSTRGERWPFRVQHFDDRPRVRRWGDYRGASSLDEAITYVVAQGGDPSRWRVRQGRRTVWP